MDTLETGAAAALIGMARHVLDDGIALGCYDQAPPTTKGVARQFDRDDIVAMSVQSHLVALGLPNTHAWKIASSLRVALRTGGEDIEALWITCSPAGRPRGVVTQRPEGASSFMVPVAELRERIAVLVAGRLARGARN